MPCNPTVTLCRGIWYWSRPAEEKYGKLWNVKMFSIKINKNKILEKTLVVGALRDQIKSVVNKYEHIPTTRAYLRKITHMISNK